MKLTCMPYIMSSCHESRGFWTDSFKGSTCTRCLLNIIELQDSFGHLDAFETFIHLMLASEMFLIQTFHLTWTHMEMTQKPLCPVQIVMRVGVLLPAVILDLSSEIQTSLEENFNAMHDDNNYGINIYLQVREFLQRITGENQ